MWAKISPVPILAVDPEELFAAGAAVVAAGEGLSAAMTVLAAGFSAHTGSDIAGEVFGLAYQSAAESLLKLATAAVNACQQDGALIQQGASNYSVAEAASNLGGGANVLQPPAAPAKVATPGPPGTLGPGEPPPSLWAVVQPLVDSVWPDGDVAGLHAAAGCWRTFGSAATGMQAALNASKALIGAQRIPEGGNIIYVLSTMGDAIGKLSEQCGKMATLFDSFARQVDQAQNKIRDLLRRLGSLTDLWHDVELVLDGDALDEIKKIAQDIDAVLHELGREARAFEQGIKLLMNLGDGLVVDMEKFVRGELRSFLGDVVGNKVATDFDFAANVIEGLGKGGVQAALGLVDLGPGWIFLDPKGAEATWKGTLESQFKASAVNQIMHPREGVQANIQMWKSLLHLDDWSTARPGLGLGENAADALTFLLPGIGEAGVGAEAGSAAVRGAEDASELAEGTGAVGRVGEFATTSRALGDIGKVGTNLTKDLENLKLYVPKSDVPLGGRPVAAPPAEAPGGPAARPVEAAPPGTPAPHSPTAPSGPVPGRPGTPAGPHEAPSAPAVGHGPVAVPSSPAEPLPPHGLIPSEPAPVPGGGGLHDPPPSVSGPSGEVPVPHDSGPQIPMPGGPHGSQPSEPSLNGPGGGSADHSEVVDGSAHSDGLEPLSSDDLGALADYTGPGYGDLNDALRNHTLDASLSARVDALKAALAKLPPYEGLVIRGSNIPAEMLELYEPGEVVVEHAFLSTTKNPAVAQLPTFAGNVEFQILSKSGRDVSPYSTFPAEQEVLFPAGTNFLVVEKVVDPITGRTFIDMIEY